MTTPNQPLPATLETLLGVGAFQIGGGGTTFGQDIDEDFVNNLVKLPFATLDNMIDILQMALLRLPIEALQAFSSLIPDWLEDSITDVASAADQIIDALQARDIPLAVSVFEQFVEDLLDSMGIPVLGDLLDKIFDLTDGFDTFFSGFNLGDGSLIEQFVNAITGSTGGLSDITDWASDIPILGDIVDAITGNPGGITDLADFFSNLLGVILDALANVDYSSVPFADLFDVIGNALKNIPGLNVGGIGGPGSVLGSIQETWDQLVGGLVGAIGSGSGLADLFNVGQEVSSRATKGLWSFDILGIRNNNSLTTGFLPSGKSNIALDQLVLTPGTVAITQSTALTAYSVIEQAIDIGAISWQGSGIINITHCFVNIYKMDPASGVNSAALHGSANLVGILTSSMQQNIYSLPGSPIHFEPGEILGVEIAIRGAGTHSVIGAVSTLVDQAVYPRRWSSVRNSGTSAPPATTWTPTYSNNVPFIEHAVSAGPVAIPHSPETYQYNTVGSSTLAVPGWVNTLEIAVVGSGGGGASGTAAYGLDGEGGDNGAWNTATWTRGTHFSGAFSVSYTVGSAGSGGPFQNFGSNGSACSASITGYSCSGAGGAGGDSYISGSARNGQSPGNQTLGGVTYVGGGTQTTAGGAGSGPGGGGSGGGYFQAGGAGAVGSVWIRFKQ